MDAHLSFSASVSPSHLPHFASKEKPKLLHIATLIHRLCQMHFCLLNSGELNKGKARSDSLSSLASHIYNFSAITLHSLGASHSEVFWRGSSPGMGLFLSSCHAKGGTGRRLGHRAVTESFLHACFTLTIPAHVLGDSSPGPHLWRAFITKFCLITVQQHKVSNPLSHVHYHPSPSLVL